jgi:outer membrane lipoprotein SlyB
MFVMPEMLVPNVRRVKGRLRHAANTCDFGVIIGYHTPATEGACGLKFRFSILALVLAGMSGCGPSYSPDTYASNAAQQANKVEQGIVVGVRNVAVSAAGTVGTVTGAAVGGIAGSQVGVGPVSAFTSLGGALVGGIGGSAAEHVTADTVAFEYIVRKPNGDLVSVTQRDKTPLALGQKVLVIGGTQARVVADYTVPPLSPAAKTGDAAKTDADAKPADTKAADTKPGDTKPGDTKAADVPLADAIKADQPAPNASVKPADTDRAAAKPDAVPPPVASSTTAAPPAVATPGAVSSGVPTVRGSTP